MWSKKKWASTARYPDFDSDSILQDLEIFWQVWGQKASAQQPWGPYWENGAEFEVKEIGCELLENLETQIGGHSWGHIEEFDLGHHLLYNGSTPCFAAYASHLHVAK